MFDSTNRTQGIAEKSVCTQQKKKEKGSEIAPGLCP